MTHCDQQKAFSMAQFAHNAESGAATELRDAAVGLAQIGKFGVRGAAAREGVVTGSDEIVPVCGLRPAWESAIAAVAAGFAVSRWTGGGLTLTLGAGFTLWCEVRDTDRRACAAGGRVPEGGALLRAAWPGCSGTSGNGYRDYGESHLRVLPGDPRPGCPRHRAGPRRSSSVCGAGHAHSDDCPAALAAYRDSTAEVDRVMTALAARRRRHVRKLEVGMLSAHCKRSYLR
jgi:hypothetical protein